MTLDQDKSESKEPTAFISYSWTSADYAARVEQLARDLSADGIHVLLDQWDLREGQDKHAFMETCVSDPETYRVLILIDPRYVERANRREGGVGTETLIISGEVYAKADQQKFIAVVMESGADGRISLPIYLKDRIYIDLSDPENYADQYERLLRNLHGKPERSRPALGKAPAFLDEEAAQLDTGQALPLFKRALIQDRHSQEGYLEEYLLRFAGAVESEAIDGVDDVTALELRVSHSIDRFTPYRDEFVELLTLLGRYGVREEMYGQLHSFFERLVTFRFTRPTRWSSGAEVENLNFITWELFLHAVGILLRADRFAGVERLLRPYYVRSRATGDGVMRGFDVIDSGFTLLQETRQQRLGTRYYSGAAQLLLTRAGITPFEVLVEADSVLWVRSVIAPTHTAQWWPHTAIYREDTGFTSLPVWARARADQSYFRNLAPVLGITDIDAAVAHLNGLGEEPFVRVGFMSLGKKTIEEMIGWPKA